MEVVVEKVSNTRFRIEPANPTHDDDPNAVAYMQEIVCSSLPGADQKVHLVFQIVEPSEVDSFKPGELIEITLTKK